MSGDQLASSIFGGGCSLTLWIHSPLARMGMGMADHQRAKNNRSSRDSVAHRTPVDGWHRPTTAAAVSMGRLSREVERGRLQQQASRHTAHCWARPISSRASLLGPLHSELSRRETRKSLFYPSTIKASPIFLI